MSTALLQATFEEHMSLYPSAVRPMPPRVQLAKPEDIGRNYALEERIAEIKAEIVAETPYEFYGRDRHHHEDIIEHISYEAPLNVRFAKLMRAAARTGVSDLALGMYFRALVEAAIKHQATLDLEKEADDEADDELVERL